MRSAIQYSVLKSKELDTVVFKDANEIETNPKINLDYLSRLFAESVNNVYNPVVDFLITDYNDKVIYQFSLSDYSDKSFYVSQQFMSSIKKIPKSIEPTYYLFDINNKKMFIVKIPYINSSNYHKNDFVYIFDFSHEDKEVAPILFILLIIIFLAFVTFITYLVIKKFLNLYIERITDYIDSFIENNIADNTKLVFSYPFKPLEERTTKLVAKIIEIEERFYTLSERFHLLLSQTNDGVYMEDSEHYIYFCNTKLAQILGYQSETDIIGKKMIDLLIGLQAKRIYEQESYFIKLSNSVKYKINISTHTNQNKPCIFTGKSIYDPKLRLKTYYYAVTDLSDIEFYSQDQTSRIQSNSNLFDNTNFPIIVFDQQTKIHELNNAAKNLFSVKLEKAKGMEINEFFKNYDMLRLLNQFDFKTNFKFDTFEPRFNQWYYIANEIVTSKDSMYSYLIFIDISDFRKNESFHNMIFDELKGFIFITNYENEVIFVSPSFLYMTQYPASWFVNYYKSMNDIIAK